MGRAVRVHTKHWIHSYKLGPNQWFKDGRIWETIDGWECCTPPVPKDIRDVEGWDLKPWDQYFQKTVAPDYMKRIKLDPVTKKLSLNAQQIAYVKSERRKIFSEGHWCFINGVPTWIHGFHYNVLNYWKISAETGDSRKEYRDRDRRRWMRWKMVEDSDTIYGMMYGKPRRDGATIDGYMMMALYPQTDYDRNAGHQHKEAESAQKGFQNLLVRPFLRQPKWLIPDNNIPAGKKTANIFRLIDGKIKKVKRGQEDDYYEEETETEDIGGTIDFRSTVFNAYDGDKLIYAFLDETGKLKDTNINDMVGVMIHCLSQGAGRIKVGNLFMPTTVEEMNEGGEEYLKLWKKSKKETWSDKTKSTASGLVTLFISSEDGLEGFIGPYGESIILDPTPRQIKFLREQDGAKGKNKVYIGARQHINDKLNQFAENGLWDEYYKFLRKHPLKEEDMFISPNSDVMFNRRVLQATKSIIQSNEALHKDLVRRGDLVWTDQTRKKLVWVDNPLNGKIQCSWFFPDPTKANRVKWNGKQASPMNGDRMVFSLDPYLKANPKNPKAGSKGAGIGLKMFDLDNEERGRMKEGYHPTPSWFVTYYGRPQIMDVFHEDILKICHYFSMPLAFENNVPLIADYFIKRGYGEFLLPSSAFVDTDMEEITKSDIITFGVAMSNAGGIGVKEKAVQLLANFIEGRGLYLDGWNWELDKEWNRLPFLDWLQDLMDFQYAQSVKNDRAMAMLPGLLYMDQRMKEIFFGSEFEGGNVSDEELAEIYEMDEDDF